MTYNPAVPVANGGPYNYEIEAIQAQLKQVPGFTAWDTVFPNGISQGSVDWINSNENPKAFPESAGDDVAGPSTSADPQTTIDPVEAMVTENPRPY